MSNSIKFLVFLFISIIHLPYLFSDDLEQLSQEKLIKLLIRNNLEIKYQLYNLKIASELVQKEKAIFESTLTASLNHEDNHTPNTAEQFYDRMYKEDYHERITSYQTGVKKLLSPGTVVSFDLLIDDIDNDLISQKYQNLEDKETSSSLNVQINQPLLKNFGTKSTEAKIDIANVSKEITSLEYINNLMNIVSESLSSYWELYYTTKQYDIYKDSVQIAQGLLITNTEMVKEGRMEGSELFDVKSDLVLRRSLLNAAKQKLITSQNKIYSLLGKPNGGNDVNFIPIDKPDFTKVEKVLANKSILKNAFMNNPKYMSGLMQLKQQDIQISYIENQNLPDLNLKASFSIASLDSRPENFIENIFNDNDESWSLGLEFKMPLSGGIDMKSELAIARYKKQQILVRLRAIEIELDNQVNTYLKRVYYCLKQLDEHAENVKLKQKLMEIESSKLDAGKSNTQKVLEKEKELNQAKNESLRAEVNLELSMIELKRIEGVLLENYDINIKIKDIKQSKDISEAIEKRYNAYMRIQ